MVHLSNVQSKIKQNKTKNKNKKNKKKTLKSRDLKKIRTVWLSQVFMIDGVTDDVNARRSDVCMHHGIFPLGGERLYCLFRACAFETRATFYIA